MSLGVARINALPIVVGIFVALSVCGRDSAAQDPAESVNPPTPPADGGPCTADVECPIGSECRCDEQGHIVLELTVGEDGSVENWTRRDESGNAVERVSSSYGGISHCVFDPPLGADTSRYVQTCREFGEDLYGNPSVMILSQTYDDDGHLVLETLDEDGDGIINEVSTRTFDEHGNRVSLVVERDQNGDGTVDSRRIRTYDTEGNQLSLERDRDGDGTPEYRETTIVDEEGISWVETWDSRFPQTVFSSPCTEPTSYVELHPGVMVTCQVSDTLLVRELDYDLDGTIDERRRETFDERGNVTLEERDEGDDGSVEWRSITSYEYDQEGRILMVLEDVTGDGPIDRICVYDPPCQGGLGWCHDQATCETTGEANFVHDFSLEIHTADDE